MSAKKTFSLRLPEDLRIESERLAKEESRTLTSLITHLLTREVAGRRGSNPVREPVMRGHRSAA
jgi:hypothetical protein